MSLARNTLLALTAAVTFGAAMASTTMPAAAWHKPHWKKWHHYHHGYYRPYYRPYYAAPVVYSSYRPAPRVVSAPPAPPAPVAAAALTQNPANCLSKAYTPEGQVVFSDNCTKELAMAPVPNVPQQQGSQQQGTQQQSEAPAPQQQSFSSRRSFNNAQPQAQPQQQ